MQNDMNLKRADDRSPVDKLSAGESSVPASPSRDNQAMERPNLSLLRERARLLRELRRFFDDRGFLEVQPPCLSRDCIVDAYIDPIEVCTKQLRLGLALPPQYYLQTSPELAMKRMLSAGAPSIYSVGPAFRAGEAGDHHNPEFTLLEWYDVGAGLDGGVALLGTLVSQVLACPNYDVTSYRQLFQDSIGLDPIAADNNVLRERVHRLDSVLVDTLGDDRDAMLDFLFSTCIQSNLGAERPLIVKNYPLSQAALAKAAEDDPQCAARFELFACGLEIANGYDELRDEAVLAERFRRSDQRRVHAGRKPLAQKNRALHRAISSDLPVCTGVALGVDRLLMARTGKRSIRDVIPFSMESA